MRYFVCVLLASFFCVLLMSIFVFAEYSIQTSLYNYLWCVCVCMQVYHFMYVLARIDICCVCVSTDNVECIAFFCAFALKVFLLCFLF